MLIKIAVIIFWISAFLIFFAMIGYPLSLLFIRKLVKKKEISKNFDYKPTCTLMVVAHNEEKVILDKLKCIEKIDYPESCLNILISSDHSDDKTDEIVKNFINGKRRFTYQLFDVKIRKGKTNAQNEAQKLVHSEILIMTDANAMLDASCIKEIASNFYDPSVAYVCGKLEYVNNFEKIASCENQYWNLDLVLRKIESDIQTITAGNGALYACRNDDYCIINPIHSHDSYMPILYGLENKRCIFDSNAIAYEKAGTNSSEEFNRKVRMNRCIFDGIIPDIRIFNVFRYHWFSYFYFGHRTCRYSLWINHILLFISSGLIFKVSDFYFYMLLIQVVLYLIAFLTKILHLKNKVCMMMYYYCMTIIAQIFGAYRTITGKAKPFWEKAESTR